MIFPVKTIGILVELQLWKKGYDNLKKGTDAGRLPLTKPAVNNLMLNYQGALLVFNLKK
jgi:hypothetical protein